MGDCAFKSCHTAPATASGVVAAAAAAINRYYFCCQTSWGRGIGKDLAYGCVQGLLNSFPPPLAGSSLYQYRHFETTEKNSEKFEGESGNKVQTKKKISNKPESSINACFRICVDNEQYQETSMRGPHRAHLFLK